MFRVLIVAPRFPPDARGGAADALGRLVQELDQHVDLQLVAGFVRAPERLPAEAVAVDLRGSRRRGTWLRLWQRARSEVARVRPDVVVVSGLGLPPLGPRMVSVVHRRPPPSRLRTLPWNRVMGRASDLVLVPHSGVGRSVIAVGVPPLRTEVLPVGMTVGPPPPMPASDLLHIVHPGPIQPSGGQHLSIDAVSRLPAEYKRRVRLVVAGRVGDGRYVAQLRVAIEGQPITLMPEAEDLPSIIADSHLALYPSPVDDGSPDAALMAMALGRPVVWAHHPLMRAALGARGLRVPPNDVEGLRSAVISALVSEDLATLGQRAHAHMRRTRSWRRLWPRWRQRLGVP